MIERHAYHPTTLDHAATLGDDWICQPKIDGVWAVATHAGDGVAIITGRRGREIGRVDVGAVLPFVLVGEWIGERQRFYAFDLLRAGPLCYKAQGFEVRARRAKRLCRMRGGCLKGHDQIVWVPTSPGRDAVRLFNLTEARPLFYDGIVMKRRAAAYNTLLGFHLKVKHSVTVDYVVTGILYTQGGTRDGEANGVQGALYLNGILCDTCKIPNLPHKWRRKMQDNPDAFIGRVVEARGQRVFKSGALRHPAFVRWRKDKPAKECVKPA